MKGSQIIKVIVPGLCPHCGKEVLVAIRTITPMIDWILKEKDLDEAKKKVQEEVEKAIFTEEEEKKMVLKWLNNKETLFGPSEVPAILQQVLPAKEEAKTEAKEEKIEEPVEEEK